MKALVIERPGVLVVKDVSEPPMGEYEARCEMLYGSTCAATDGAVIAGKFALDVEYPCILGHESVGRVIEIGAKVRNYKVGDLVARVYTRETDGIHLAWGGMAEFGLALDWKAMKEDGIPSEEWDYYRVNQVIPEGVMDPIDATMIITWRENLSWVNRMGIKENDRVIVVGSGANGLSIGACAKCKGAEVYLVGNSSRQGNAENLGLAFLDYKDQNTLDTFIAANAQKIDYILDATGKKETLTQYMPCLKENGTAGVYGMNDYHNYTFNPIRGPKQFRFFNSYAGIYDEAETHYEVLSLVSEGKLNADDWLYKDEIFTWDNAPAAYDLVKSRKAIKAVIKLSTK